MQPGAAPERQGGAVPPRKSPRASFTFPRPLSTAANQADAGPSTPTVRRPLQQLHRHSKKTLDALRLLKTLASETDRAEEEGGIVSALEERGWVHQGERNGVHIFSQEDEEEETPQQSLPPSRKYSSSTTDDTKSRMTGGLHESSRQKSRGVRANESLPHFRGEAFLRGSWRVEDIVATARSYGARAVWDTSFDLRSHVVEHLSATDTLSHLWIKGSFPVGGRDASLASTAVYEGRTAYLASTSVDDPLIPRAGTRSLVRLNGMVFQVVEKAPAFYPSDLKSPAPESSPPPVSKPALLHRHSKSNATVTEFTHSAKPSLSGAGKWSRMPGLVEGGKNRVVSGDSAATWTPSGSPMAAKRASAPPAEEKSEESSQEGSGLHVSILVRALPGGNLPATYVNALNVSVANRLGRLITHIEKSGFAPYLVRDKPKSQLRVLEETFEPLRSAYALVFHTTADTKDAVTRVRFCGLSFGSKCGIEVKGTDRYSVEYDVPPVAEDDETACSWPDLAKLPGARGGCTLLIQNAEIAGRTCTVKLSKKADLADARRILKHGFAFEKAAEEGRDRQLDLVDELFTDETVEALRVIDGARAVLQHLSLASAAGNPVPLALEA